jgi:hypothetical protein
MLQGFAEVLQEAVRTKTPDLLEFVAKKLEERSGLDATVFEAHFEEFKRKPRTYVLEELCPIGQDPLWWVPMRYNDETILNMLRTRAHDIIGDILAQDLIEDSQNLFHRARVAYPELMYLRDSTENEQAAAQTLRSLYLGCSSCSSIVDNGLDDADPMLAFRCRPLVTCARNCFFESCRQIERADALLVTCLLLVVGRNPGFQQRYGGGHRTPELAVIYAMEHEPESLPSFSRLVLADRQLVLATFQAYFPMEMLVNVEVAPAHFARVKDLLTAREDGTDFFLSALGVEHLVRCRSTIFPDASVDLVRLATQCIAALNKHSGPRAYELYLKKRAERHSWRLVRDDHLHRAVIRLCCMRGSEEDDAWGEMLTTVEGLDDRKQGVLQTELGQKDGIVDSPVYILNGGGALMAASCGNADVGLPAAVSLLVRAIEDVRERYGKVVNHKVVNIRLESLAARAMQYRTGGGSMFEDTPFTLQEVGAGEVAINVVPGL